MAGLLDRLLGGFAPLRAEERGGEAETVTRYEILELIALGIIAAVVLSFLPACASDPAAPIQAYREQTARINAEHTEQLLWARQPPPPYPRYFH